MLKVSVFGYPGLTIGADRGRLCLPDVIILERPPHPPDMVFSSIQHAIAQLGAIETRIDQGGGGAQQFVLHIAHGAHLDLNDLHPIAHARRPAHVNLVIGITPPPVGS